jgi:hypothetical protein
MPTPVVGTDSYVTVAEADAYHLASIHGANWTAAVNLTKEQALLTATRMLERQEWVGTKTSPVQALDWPRTGVTYPDGTPVPSATVPQFIKDAECELALALINDQSVQINEDTSNNIRRLKAGSAEIEYFRPTSGSRFPTIVAELVNFYLASAAGFSAPNWGDVETETQISDFEVTDGL